MHMHMATYERKGGGINTRHSRSISHQNQRKESSLTTFSFGRRQGTQNGTYYIDIKRSALPTPLAFSSCCHKHLTFFFFHRRNLSKKIDKKRERTAPLGKVRIKKLYDAIKKKTAIPTDFGEISRFPRLPLPATTFRCTPRHGAFFCRWGRCVPAPPWPYTWEKTR
ncbi:hypothetical protein CEXT_531401 [Caerostris extrusa]|uniref:Uncharacterized protein n=1 Tax=Caerostris extrusa TaxID=172846 RepID=A0AAV4Y237_CAEEX|nr:hypothetical protein CEXT_531401 [Caerostris extrusa]